MSVVTNVVTPSIKLEGTAGRAIHFVRIGSALLFIVEPMIAKMILPLLAGRRRCGTTAWSSTW